ncbi:hypothetical protein Tco_0243014, partial [Tanacetum coccineum]
FEEVQKLYEREKKWIDDFKPIDDDSQQQAESTKKDQEQILKKRVLLMNTRVDIHMMIEKKYPLTQEMLSRMLNRRLEVDYESEMAFKLIRFTKSQLQK